MAIIRSLGRKHSPRGMQVESVGNQDIACVCRYPDEAPTLDLFCCTLNGLRRGLGGVNFNKVCSHEKGR